MLKIVFYFCVFLDGCALGVGIGCYECFECGVVLGDSGEVDTYHFATAGFALVKQSVVSWDGEL